MRACLLTLVLGGCLLIPADEHDEKRSGGGDTDIIPSASAPVVTDISYRFRFTSTGLIEGLWLVFKAVDEDGDLAGGRVNIPEGFVTFSEAMTLVDDQYAVPLEWDFSEPCAPQQQEVPFEVVDEAGNTATPVVEVLYTLEEHNEASQTSADQLEPVVTLALEQMPAVVCGFKGVTSGFVDFYDEVQTFPAGTPMDVTVNYGPGADNLSLFIYFNNTLHEQIESTPTVGERSLFDPPASGPVYLDIGSSDSAFPEADWVMFIQPQLPPVAP